jgi:hypothetical protein
LEAIHQTINTTSLQVAHRVYSSLFGDLRHIFHPEINPRRIVHTRKSREISFTLSYTFAACDDRLLHTDGVNAGKRQVMFRRMKEANLVFSRNTSSRWQVVLKFR